MDKQTLSNYGWVIICVLVLVVMMALATPFGKYVATAVQNTTTALTATANKQAENAGGILDIEEPEFWNDEQNSVRVYYERVYETEVEGTLVLGIWHRDGSVSYYLSGFDETRIVPVTDTRFVNQEIHYKDPYCPSIEGFFRGNEDGTKVTISWYWYEDYDYETDIFQSAVYAGEEEMKITDYKTIEEWHNAQI